MARPKHSLQQPPLHAEADLAGQVALAVKAAEERHGLGQFFTPTDLAELIAQEFDAEWASRLNDVGTIRLLDPGAGTGTLGLALLERLLQIGITRPIELITVEIDEHLHEPLRANLEAAREVLANEGRGFSFKIVKGDFLDAIDSRAVAGDFQGAILNPPYGKMHRTDSRLATRHALVHGQPNIYALFLAESLKLLGPHGRMAAICPRSFASGPYFGRIRESLRSNGTLRKVTMFARRDELFSRDAVLQETVVASWDRVPHKESMKFDLRVLEPRGFVETFSTRLSLPSGSEPWFLPNSQAELEAIERLSGWPSRLDSLDITVRTGPVVFFRTKQGRMKAQDGTVPFVWMNNLRLDGEVEWPQENPQRPQFFAPSERDPLVVPNQWLVLVRRFSSRDDAKRLVVSVWNPGKSPATSIAIENRVNVIMGGSSPFTQEQAELVAHHLRRPEVESWFRARSGTTQVNATDLRAVPFEYARIPRVSFWRWLADALQRTG